MVENPDIMRKLTMFGATTTTTSESNNGLKVILESESWRFISSIAHIGLHNKSGSTTDYTIKLTELKDLDMLPPSLQAKYEIFDNIFKRSDASQVS